jgi:hypothetical protein
MMKMKKILAVCVIILFIGVAVAPSINTSIVKASQEDDLVEVTTQACGIQGYEDTTVKLTREQYEKLEEYLVELRARLNQTTTREEAVPIFKDAVVELDKYGLLGNLTIEEAENCIFFWYKDTIMTKKLYSNTRRNLCCLVTGRVNRSIAVHRVNSWIWWADKFLISFGITIFEQFPKQFPNLSFLLLPLFLIGVLGIVLLEVLGASWEQFADNNPIAFFDVICAGYVLLGDTYKYGNGWVDSIGLLGEKKWSGQFMGNLPGRKIAFTDIAYLYYPGIYAFNGIQINFPEIGDKYFLGSALAVGFDIKQ